MFDYEEKVLLNKVLINSINICNINYQEAKRNDDKKLMNRAVEEKMKLQHIKRKIGC